MDQTVKERLVGMGVLLVLGVIFIPLILDGDTLQLDKNPSQNLNLPVPIESITHEMNFSDGNVRRISLPHPENDNTQDNNLDNSAIPKSSTSTESTLKTIPSTGFIKELPNEATINAGAKTESVSKQETTQLNLQPSGSIDRSKSTSAEAISSKSVSESAWVVQIGSFGDRKNAEKEVASLKAKGFPAFVRRFVTAEDKVLYRVRIGPEKDRVRAEKLAERLSKAGIKGQIVADP